MPDDRPIQQIEDILLELKVGNETALDRLTTLLGHGLGAYKNHCRRYQRFNGHCYWQRPSHHRVTVE